MPRDGQYVSEPLALSVHTPVLAEMFRGTLRHALGLGYTANLRFLLVRRASAGAGGGLRPMSYSILIYVA